jgi:predicted lipid-binding transport protein (Tim44 family)
MLAGCPGGSRCADPDDIGGNLGARPGPGPPNKASSQTVILSGPCPLWPVTVDGGRRHPGVTRWRVKATAARRERRAHTGGMSRMIWAILGVILAAWVGFMALGRIFAMLKTFLIIGLIAVVVVIVVWLLAGRARRSNAAR